MGSPKAQKVSCRGPDRPRAAHAPSDGRRRPPPPSPLARPPPPRGEGRAQLAPPPGETQGAEEGQPPHPARMLRVTPRSRGSLVLGRGQRRGVRSGQVGGVDPARGGGPCGGGPGAGAQAYLRRCGHARLPVRR